MPYSYDPVFAADPNNPSTVASNAAITIFNPSDAGKAPITITDVTGSPLPNPITVNRNGFGPAFQHPTLDRVGWHGGGFTGYFTSYEGMKAETVSARSAAQAAQAAAAEAATLAQAPTNQQVDAGIARANIPAKVAEVVATDPTVASAAAGLAQSDAGLVRKTDPAIPQTAPTTPLVYVTTGQPANFSLYGTDPAGRIPETFSLGPDGRVTNDVIADWAARMATPAAPARLAMFGDSMTALGKDTATSVPDIIAADLGIQVFNGGASGQTTTEIALRQGGLDLYVTVQDDAIPAARTYHPVTAISVSAQWRGGQFRGTIAGIPGILDRTAEGVWTFQRDTAGNLTSVPKETPFIITEGKTHDGWTQIIRAGRNLPSLEYTQRDVRAMVARIRRAGGKFLVLPVYNTSAEPSGSAGYNIIKAINDWLALEYSGNFYDLRGWFIRNGLAEAGITPTAADTTAIAEDRIPPSLMTDTTHLTEAGRIIEGHRLAKIITAKGLI